MAIEWLDFLKTLESLELIALAHLVFVRSPV